MDTFRKQFRVKIETNNRLPIRINAIEHYTSRLVEGGPALLIDPVECPYLVRALKGGWRFTLNPKNDEQKGAEPEKNAYSHPGDGFGYLCRYFHRQAERGYRDNASTTKPLVIPRNFGNNTYHVR